MNSAINHSGFIDLLKKPSTGTIHFDRTDEAEGQEAAMYHQAQQSPDLCHASADMITGNNE